jgi:hypothetical protein
MKNYDISYEIDALYFPLCDIYIWTYTPSKYNLLSMPPPVLRKCNQFK